MKYLFLLVTLFFSHPAIADDYQDQIDTFFDNIGRGDVDAAVSELYKSNKYVSAIPDQLQTVRNQLNAVNGLVGNMIGKEKLDTYQVGSSLVHITYIAIYDRQPIRFEFQFFKAGDEWRIFSMSFDDDLDDEIEVLARRRALSAGK